MFSANYSRQFLQSDFDLCVHTDAFRNIHSNAILLTKTRINKWLHFIQEN